MTTVLQKTGIALLSLGLCFSNAWNVLADEEAASHRRAASQSASGIEPDVLQQRFQDLTTHEQLKKTLLRIQRFARNKVVVGPLIRNHDNQGIIDIDSELASESWMQPHVCGTDHPTPTIREAVLCTVNDGGRGNHNPIAVGLSTQGRELWAARLGNPQGIKVMVITQQHGNEVRSTEATLRFIRYLTHARNSQAQKILENVNLLILVRANPDGGEPSSDCFIGTPIGSVITEDCALTRTNVDPQAGGGYSEDSEEDFFGTVGVGYNLNRYHFVDLKHPIRPQEAQAMVAVGLAWRPEVVLDLHGDISKTSCVIDPASIMPGALVGGLPSAQCQDGSPQSPVVFSPVVTTLNEDAGIQQRRSRTLAARVAKKIQRLGFGVVNRFAQIQTGAGTVNDGSSAAYAKLGAIVGGWESQNFTNAVSLSIQRVVNGMPVPGLNPEWFRGGRAFAFINTFMNIVAFQEALLTVSTWRSQEPAGEEGYCDLPLTTAIHVAFPEDVFGPVPGYGPFLIPLIGELRQVLDSCPE
ncbi:MAG: hypothetical protein NPIRA02_15870 [Nitrospirales bacterium]|nr:MAG: hypothetical protein NPIRA02_15870 [Nitrospirales bacterium]